MTFSEAIAQFGTGSNTITNSQDPTITNRGEVYYGNGKCKSNTNWSSQQYQAMLVFIEYALGQSIDINVN